MFPLYLCNFVNRHCFVIILFWIQLGLHTLYISTSRSSKDILWISNERVGGWLGGGVMFSILNQEILFGNKVCAFLYVQYGVSYLLLLYSQWHDIPDFLVLIYLSISALLEFNSFPWAYHTKHVAVDLSRNNCSHWLKKFTKFTKAIFVECQNKASRSYQHFMNLKKSKNNRWKYLGYFIPETVMCKFNQR